VSSYSRDEVEALLPAVWDRDAVWGIPKKDAPDPDMPKAAGDPRKSNALWDLIIDVRSAWEKAPLTLNERRALLLRFGTDMKQDEIAELLGRKRQNIGTSIYTGVGKLVAHLNGDEWKEILD